MPQDNTPNAQAAAGAGSTDPQALAATIPPTTPPPNAQAADGNSDDNETLTLEAARKLRSEAASLRQRERAALEKLATLEEAERKRADADLTAQQRAEKALTEKTTAFDTQVASLRERVISSVVEAQAARLGIIDPTDAMRLLDRAALELDGDGIPTNLDKLLAALVKAKPYLVRNGTTPPPSVGATNPPRSTSQSGGEWTMERYTQLPKNGGYAALSAADKASLAQWLVKQGRY